MRSSYSLDISLNVTEFKVVKVLRRNVLGIVRFVFAEFAFKMDTSINYNCRNFCFARVETKLIEKKVIPENVDNNNPLRIPEQR